MGVSGSGFMKKGLAGLFEIFDLRIKDRFCAEVQAKPDGYDARGGTCPDFLSGAVARAQDEELGFECFGAVHGDGGEPGASGYPLLVWVEDMMR
jgi:hypothetical protein